MRNLTLAAAALLCSASALAQTPGTSPDPATHPHGSATTGTTASGTVTEPPAPPTSTTTAPTTGAGTSATTTSATTTTGTADLAAHDSNRDGALSPLEFGQHLAAMKGDSALSAEARRERYSRAADNGAIKLLNQSAADFSKADKNMDKQVDSTELAMWQSGDASASASAAPTTPITSGAGSMSSAPSTTDTTSGTSTSTTTESSTSITSGAGTTGTAPDTSATMTPSTPPDEPPSDTPPDDMTDDLQNSPDPNESTTTPPPTE